MGNSSLRQQREFPDGAGVLHLPQSGCVSRARPAGQKKSGVRWARPAGQSFSPAALAPPELVPEAVEPPPG